MSTHSPASEGTDFGQVFEERARPLAVEQRGIQVIPPEDQYAKPRDLFWMWTGALFNVETLVTGALLIAIGLSFAQAVILIVLGNISYVIVGICSIQGPSARTSTFAISRAAFGPNGARSVSVFNWITMIGYEVLGLSLVVLAGLALLAKAGLQSSIALKVIVILVATGIQFLIPFFGHATILRLLKYLTYPFAALFVIMAVLTFMKVDISALHQQGSWATVTLGLALVIATAGLGWSTQASDYSRYVPASASRRSVVLWVALGGYIPGTLLMLIGAGAAAAVPAATNPISGLPQVFPGWFLVPYLIVILPQLFAINGITLYSSGLTLQAIGLRIRRWHAVLIDTVIASILTFLITFSSSFYTFLSDLLLFVIVWVGPWTGIFLVDYFLRRGRYDSKALFGRLGSVYWSNNGFRVAALVAQVVGMLAALSWLDVSPVFEGPLSSHTMGADLSAWMGLVFGAVVYFLLARRSVAGELARDSQSDLAPTISSKA